MIRMVWCRRVEPARTFALGILCDLKQVERAELDQGTTTIKPAGGRNRPGRHQCQAAHGRPTLLHRVPFLLSVHSKANRPLRVPAFPSKPGFPGLAAHWP